MVIVVILGWVGVLLVLGTYVATRWYPSKIYDWGNFLGSPLVALPALVAGIWSVAAISAAFWCIGAWKLWKGRHGRDQGATNGDREVANS